MEGPSRRQNDELSLAGIALVFLVIFFGLLKTVVILGVAATLAIVPQFRTVLDAFAGQQPHSAKPTPELSSALTDSSSDKDLHVHSSNSLQVPERLQEPLERLLQLVVRDFITDWYSSYISLGDARFPLEARHALNVLVSNLVNRVRALQRKEVAIYMLSSLSNAVLRQMQGLAADETPEMLIQKLRKAAEELLHTTAPPSALAAPANMALLSEILVLQLWKLVESIDSDFINLTIISYLGEDQPTLREQVTEKAQDLVELQSHTNQNLSQTPIVPSKMKPAAAAAPARSTSMDLAPLPDIAALKRCLAGPPELVESLLVQADQYFTQHPEPIAGDRDALLTSILDGSNEVLADSFGEYIESIEPEAKSRGRLLERLYGRTVSLHQLLSLGTESDGVRQDTIEALLQFIDTLREDWSDRVLTTTLHACLARIHRRQTDVFVPLQRWIELQLEQSHFQPFIKLTEANDGLDLTSPVSERTSFSDNHTTSSIQRPSIDSTTSVTSPTAGMSLTNASVDSVISDQVDFSSINVTLTDISEPDAYDSTTRRMKSKRHLSFLVALELSDGAPGYVIMRSYPEIERMDAALTKLFPQAGSSAAFPRALLPTPTHKISDNICRELEGYLNHLLSDAHYGPSAPVQDFFQKERSGPAQPAMSLWDLGKNAQKASRSIARSGEGVINGVGSVLGGFKPPSEMPRFMRLGTPGEQTLPAAQAASTTAKPARMEASRSSEGRPQQPKPGPSRTESKQSFDSVRTSSSSGAAASTSSAPNIGPMAPLSADSSPRMSKDIPLEKSPKLAQMQTQTHHRRSSSHHRDHRPVNLTATDLDHIISSALAVLEEAYLLSNSQWSFKRGLLKVIETVVRNSYLSLIGAAFLEALHTLNLESSALRIDSLRESFWPNGVWYASAPTQPPQRTEQQKVEAKAEAKRLLHAQAPEGLKLALGANATVDALDRLHETLQGESASRITAAVVLDMLRILLL